MALNSVENNIGNTLPEYDVSIVLNLHNEARYLTRTMLSLEAAVLHARQNDITFEVIVVLDRADTATRNLAENYDYSIFDSVKIIHVSNGSLGLSRNDGISVASGEYIATADADDLVSFDFFLKLCTTARSSSGDVIIFPEYIVGFGEKNYAWKFYGREAIGNSTFFSSHPYISRIFCKRKLFEQIKYSDVSAKSGFAYEDWHFNCECISLKYSIEIAKGAILFYRQRPGSLLRQAEAGASRMIPASKYFDPETFIELAQAEFNEETRQKIPERPFSLRDFLLEEGIADIFAAANRIDPAISIGIIRYGHAGSNLPPASDATVAYFHLCKAIDTTGYTDVILLPFLTKGGAEKYIISVTHAIKNLSPSSRCLFLCGQKFDNHEWVGKLPADSTFIDLHDLVQTNLSTQDVLLITYRLVQNMRRTKRVHVKGSEYGSEFIKNYSSKLGSIELYYYYFCDEVIYYRGSEHVNGYSFDLVSEFGPNITGIISDHKKNIEFVDRIVGKGSIGRTHALYAVCDTDRMLPSLEITSQSRLLWASRIDAQKRPELVRKIAARLADTQPGVLIEVFGSTTYGEIDQTVFGAEPNIIYQGAFNGFSQIPAGKYDALIYTAAFDGLPNIVLEAMAAGMPVIAPDIGGIGEAVTIKTGYLVEDDGDDETLVDRYMEAIALLYADRAEAIERGKAARALMLERHSESAFLQNVQKIFQLV